MLAARVEQKNGMTEEDKNGVIPLTNAWRHNHAHAQLSCVEQTFGKVVGQPDAAVRRRISRQNSTMESDARPGDALHVRHVGIVIMVGVVLGFFLNDAEDTGRCLASLLPARHRRSQGPAVGVVDSDPLVAKRNDGHDRLAERDSTDLTDRSFRRLAAPACSPAAITAAKLTMARRTGGNQVCLSFGFTKQDVMHVPWDRVDGENS